jgi:hypothetical protein
MGKCERHEVATTSRDPLRRGEGPCAHRMQTDAGRAPAQGGPLRWECPCAGRVPACNQFPDVCITFSVSGPVSRGANVSRHLRSLKRQLPICVRTPIFILRRLRHVFLTFPNTAPTFPSIFQSVKQQPPICVRTVNFTLRRVRHVFLTFQHKLIRRSSWSIYPFGAGAESKGDAVVRLGYICIAPAGLNVKGVISPIKCVEAPSVH